jgi:uncharacterized protein (DUF849 family)
MSQIIINFTPTGMVPTKDMTPHVPVSPKEIVADVLRCAELGASMVHLHARNERGEPTYEKAVYREIIQGIREVNRELILCVSTSGRTFPEFEKRSEVLELHGPCKPDMASLTLGSMNFSRTASLNSPEIIEALLHKMNQHGIKPELEVFDTGMINHARYLIHKKLLGPPYYFNLLLGNVATAQADLITIGHMLSQLPEPSIWGLAGIGNAQRFVTSLALVCGGAVRVGLEDNIYLDEARTALATNAMLVQRTADTAAALGMSVATPAEVRRMLELPPA